MVWVLRSREFKLGGWNRLSQIPEAKEGARRRDSCQPPRLSKASVHITCPTIRSLKAICNAGDKVREILKATASGCSIHVLGSRASSLSLWRLDRPGCVVWTC